MFKIFVPKANHTFEIDFHALPEHIQTEVIAYGLKQKLNDKVSQISPKSNPDNMNEVALGLVQGLVDDMHKGTWAQRASGAGRSSVDPVVKEMQRLAAERVKLALKAKGLTVAKVGKEKFANFVGQCFDKNYDTLEAEAKKRLDSVQELDLKLDF